MLRVSGAALRQPREQRQAAVVLADALVEVHERRQRLLVVARAALQASQLGYRARSLAALDQRFGQAKDVVGVARRGADQRLVLAHRLVERALHLEQLHDLQARADVARLAPEHLAVGGERLVDAAGFLVQRRQEPELVGVESRLLL